MAEQDERAAFEAWKEGNAFLGIEPTWAAWKARAELAATPAPAPAQAQQAGWLRADIIRAAVAAMPHTNPGVADDLLHGDTMHTEADDVVAIFCAGMRAATPAPAPGWQPIETAPKDGSVIVLSRGQQAFAGYWGEGQYTTGWLASGSTLVMAFNNINPPTHWMPLPAAPEAGQGKEASNAD